MFCINIIKSSKNCKTTYSSQYRNKSVVEFIIKRNKSSVENKIKNETE